MDQFVLCIRQPGHLDQPENLRRAFAKPNWSYFLLPNNGGSIAYREPAAKWESASKLVMVFGQLIPRAGSKTSITNHPSIQGLLQSHWGKFVICEIDKYTGEVFLATDHLGAKPCYYHEGQTSFTAFLQLEDYKTLYGQFPALNARFLASQIAFSQITTDHTAFENVRQIPPGNVMRINHGKVSLKTYWSPIQVAELSIGDVRAEAEHEEELRSAVKYSVKSLSIGHQRALIFLSGGLDSSIIAACLAQEIGAENILGFNVSDDSVIGDESWHAELVSQRTGISIYRHRLRADDFRLIDELKGSVRPVPNKYGAGFEILRKANEVATENKMTAIFSGAGGDAIYLAARTSKYAHDYMKTVGYRGLWKKIEETAYMSHKTVWQVCYDLLEFNYSKKKRKVSPYKNYINRLFLSAKANEEIDLTYLNNSWINASKHLPRGKQHQILNLISSSHANADAALLDTQQVSHPLLALPVVEACLRAPTYVLSGRNIDRSLARRAFFEELPAQVACRRTKGGGGAFYFELINNEKARLRNYLANGALSNLGIIDPSKVERVMDQLGDGKEYESHTKLYELTITEAWARAAGVGF